MATIRPIIRYNRNSLRAAALAEALLSDEEREAGENDARSEAKIPDSLWSVNPLSRGPQPSAPPAPEDEVPPPPPPVTPPPPPPLEVPDAPGDVPDVRFEFKCVDSIDINVLKDRAYRLVGDGDTKKSSRSRGECIQPFGKRPGRNDDGSWNYKDCVYLPQLDLHTEWSYMYRVPVSRVSFCMTALFWLLTLVVFSDHWRWLVFPCLIHVAVEMLVPTKCHVVSYKLMDRRRPELDDVRSPECLYAPPVCHPQFVYFERREGDVLLDLVGTFRMLRRNAICDQNEFGWDLSSLLRKRQGLSWWLRVVVWLFYFCRGAGRLSFIDRTIRSTALVSMTAALSYDTGRQEFGVCDVKKIRNFLLRHIPGSNWDSRSHHTALINTSHYIYDRNVWNTVECGAEWSHHFPSSPDLPWARSVRTPDDT